MAVMEISVVPVGTGSPSVGDYVAGCLQILEEEGLRYELTAMGTQVQGEVRKLLEVAQRLHEVPFRMGALRVVTTIKLDDRKDKPLP